MLQHHSTGWVLYSTVHVTGWKYCILKTVFCSCRCVCEPAITGGDSLRFGPVRRLPLCLLEALLDTMAGGRPIPRHQREPHLGPSPAPGHLHRAGCYPRQKALRPRVRGEGDDTDAIAGARRSSVGALVSAAGDHTDGHGGGRHEDQPHFAWHPAGGAVQEPAELHPWDPAHAQADHRPRVSLCALHVQLGDWVSIASIVLSWWNSQNGLYC